MTEVHSNMLNRITPTQTWPFPEIGQNLRIVELESVMRRQDLRIVELENVMRMQDLRIVELENRIYLKQQSIDIQTFFDVIKSVVQGIEENHTIDDILDQIKLLLDKEGSQSLMESHKELDAGIEESYDNVDDLIKSLKFP
jgi:hypothetical protein